MSPKLGAPWKQNVRHRKQSTSCRCSQHPLKHMYPMEHTAWKWGCRQNQVGSRTGARKTRHLCTTHFTDFPNFLTGFLF